MKTKFVKGQRVVTVEAADVRALKVAQQLAAEIGTQYTDVDANAAAEALGKVIARHTPEAKPVKDGTPPADAPKAK